MATSTLNRASHNRKDLMPFPDIEDYLMLSVVTKNPHELNPQTTDNYQRTLPDLGGYEV
jgi:hypothetical protein